MNVMYHITFSICFSRQNYFNLHILLFVWRQMFFKRIQSKNQVDDNILVITLQKVPAQWMTIIRNFQQKERKKKIWPLFVGENVYKLNTQTITKEHTQITKLDHVVLILSFLFTDLKRYHPINSSKKWHPDKVMVVCP